MRNKNNWWPWKTASPWIAFAFACVAIVPLLFMVILISTSEILAVQGAQSGATVLSTLAVFCLGLYILYGALVHSIVLSSAQLFARNGKVSLIDLFSGIRTRYFRVLWYDLIALVLIIPPALFLAAGLLESYYAEWVRILLISGSSAWMLLHIFGFVWGSFMLESRGVLRSIGDSFNTSFRNIKQTVFSLILMLIFGIVSAVLFALISGTLTSEAAGVQLGAILLSASTMVLSSQWYFPLNFMLVGDVTRQLTFMLLNAFLFVSAVHVLAVRAQRVLSPDSNKDEDLTREEERVLEKLLEKPDPKEEELIIDTAVELLEKEVEQEEKVLKATKKKSSKKKSSKKSAKKTRKKSSKKRSKKSTP